MAANPGNPTVGAPNSPRILEAAVLPKTPVLGAVERGGRVVAEPSESISSNAILGFIGRHVDRASLLITDEYRAYRGAEKMMRHATIEHAKQYADGLTHTNTIEGFWSLLKRAWFGQHHHYTPEHTFAYVVEACYKYNVRGMADPFSHFIRGAVLA